MIPIHRRAIQSNYTSLVEQTDLDAVVTALYEKGVFSEQMIEQFKDTNKSVRDRKRKLYRDITLRGPRAFNQLVETLSELGYWTIVRDLDPENPFNSSMDPRGLLFPKPNPHKSPDETSREFLSISTEKNRTKVNGPKLVPSPPAPPRASSPGDDDQLAPEQVTIPQFKVTKSTKFMEDDDSKDLKLYRTRGRSRGLLLVFSYISFPKNIEEFREGVDIDCHNLKYLFSEFGFRVLSYKNLTYEETKKTLEGLILENEECVFIVVSSHGYEKLGSSDTDVRCSDGRLVSLYKIIEYFNNHNLPHLVGTPKVFIFQTCRGENDDFVWKKKVSPPSKMSMPRGAANTHKDGSAAPRGAAAAAAPAATHELEETPVYSDILIAHSTLPGFASHRDVKLGSWYIQVLCEVFAARAHDCHVDKLFTLVDRRLREQFHVQTSSVDRWGFNNKLYLHPGLFEEPQPA